MKIKRGRRGCGGEDCGEDDDDGSVYIMCFNDCGNGDDRGKGRGGDENGDDGDDDKSG